MRKIGLLLIVLCVSSVSFGIGTSDVDVVNLADPGDTGPFATTDNLVVLFDASIPGTTYNGHTQTVTEMGTMTIVDVRLTNNLPGGNINVTDFPLLVIPAPQGPGVHAVVVRIWGTYHSRFGFAMPNMLLGSTSDSFVVNSDLGIPWWPWWPW